MYIKKILTAVAVLYLGLSLNLYAENQNAGNHYVFNLIGSGAMYPGTVPDIDGDLVDDDAICFDVDLVNGINQQIIGTATDCLSNIEPAGFGLQLVGTTFFHLPQGTLITRGNTSVQPIGHPITTPDGQMITHVTGASGEENAIIGGTGSFSNREGTVRLSGMVDMTNFSGEGTPIAFDCLFIINFY